MKNQKRKNKFKGFTLVEVMTSLVIMTILIAIASAVIIVTFDIFARSAVKRAAQNNGNNVYNYIYDHLSYVTALKIDKSDDINIKDLDNIEQTLKALNYNDSELEAVLEYIENDNGEKKLNRPYFEKLIIDKKHMTVQRKDINKDVYIYGNSENENTMNGCECIVSFDEYNAADTIGFTVKIERGDEVFYEKHGSVPLLNKKTDSNLVNHIKVDAVDNDSDIETEKIEIFYTYIW